LTRVLPCSSTELRMADFPAILDLDLDLDLTPLNVFTPWLSQLDNALAELSGTPVDAMVHELIRAAVALLPLGHLAKMLGVLLRHPAQASLCSKIKGMMQAQLHVESQQLVREAQQHLPGARTRALELLRTVAIPLRRHALAYDTLADLMAPFIQLSLASLHGDWGHVQDINHPDLTAIWLSTYGEHVHQGVAGFAIAAVASTPLQRAQAFERVLECLGALSIRDPACVFPQSTIQFMADYVSTLPRGEAVSVLASCSHMPQPRLLERLAADLLRREAQRPDVQQGLADRLAGCLMELDATAGDRSAYQRAAQFILDQGSRLAQRERRHLRAASPGPVFGPVPPPAVAFSPTAPTPVPTELPNRMGAAPSSSSDDMPALEEPSSGSASDSSEGGDVPRGNLTGRRIVDHYMQATTRRQRTAAARAAADASQAAAAPQGPAPLE
jgi:hypothetical protein